MVVRNASILPDIAREIAALAQRRLDETLQPKGTDVQGLLQLHLTLTDLVQRGWITTQEVMNEGVEADTLRAILTEFREGVQSLLESVISLRKVTGETRDSREALDTSEATLRTLVNEATKLLDWLARPWPPLDAERLARGIAQAERGEVISAEDFLAQLRAGEGS